MKAPGHMGDEWAPGGWVVPVPPKLFAGAMAWADGNANKVIPTTGRIDIDGSVCRIRQTPLSRTMFSMHDYLKARRKAGWYMPIMVRMFALVKLANGIPGAMREENGHAMIRSDLVASAAISPLSVRSDRFNIRKMLHP